MRNIVGLLFLSVLLSGCYTSSLTYVAPAAAPAVTGNATQSLVSTSLSYAVKEKTGKSPLEHVLNEHQARTLESKKKALNPCEKNLTFCSAIKARIIETRKQILIKKQLEKTRAEIFKLKPKKIVQLKE